MELRTINTFCTSPSCTAFPALRGSWAIPSRRCPPRSHSWRPSWAPAVRPRGQNGAPHRCRADLFRLRPHPAGHRPAGAGRPAARPADRGSLRIALADSGVQHLSAGAAAALPRPVPAGGAGAAHRHCRRMLQIAEHKSGRPGLTLDQPSCSLRWCWRRMYRSRCDPASVARKAHSHSTFLPRRVSASPSGDELPGRTGPVHGGARLAIHPYLELLRCQRQMVAGMGLFVGVHRAQRTGRVWAVNVPDHRHDAPAAVLPPR